MDISSADRVELMKLAFAIASDHSRVSTPYPSTLEAVLAIYRQLLSALTAQ